MDTGNSLRSASVEVFSFDLFDTFVLRRCSGPEGIFERAFALAPIPAGHAHRSEEFVRRRQQAEAVAREAAFAATGSSEVTVEDVYRALPPAAFGLAEHDVAALVAAEFQAEQELCAVNPELLEPFRALRRAGVRVGFVADSCWGRDHLDRLLRHCAPGLEWDFLFSSCDLRAGKADSLFSRVLALLGVKPGAAAHLGDNELADVIAAGTLGMHAIRYPQSGAALAALFRREDALFEHAWAGRAVSRRLDGGLRAVRRAVAARAPSGSAAFDYGMRVLGPVTAAFDRFTAARVETLSRDRLPVAVVFAGEHGLLPLEIWRVLRDAPAVHLPVIDLGALRAALPTLDLCRHAVVVVETTGEGTALAALRAQARAAGAEHCWHGAHLLGGLLSDAALPPGLLGGLRDRASVLERLCGATGESRPFREMCDMVRLGAAYFAREAAAMGSLAEVLAPPRAVPWLAAILARALLHPTGDERALLAALDISPRGGESCDTTEIALIAGDRQHTVTASRLRSGSGEVRLRVPVPRHMGAGTVAVAVPAAALPARGAVRAVTLQSGDTTVEAMRSARIRTLPLAALHCQDMALGRLVIELPPLEQAMALVTLTVSAS